MVDYDDAITAWKLKICQSDIVNVKKCAYLYDTFGFIIHRPQEDCAQCTYHNECECENKKSCQLSR